MKQVGVVLAGCGVYDGAEIYEATLTLLFLDSRGIAYQCLAPDVDQMHVVDHRTGEPTTERRNVLAEAARVARGQIEKLDDNWIAKLDAVIFPGGFGAAKNYCDYAIRGDECGIRPEIESFMNGMVEAGKPLGVICISPVILARALKGRDVHPLLTVGGESDAARSIETFGSRHQICDVTECVVDHEHKIVSTPAYMCDTHIAEVAQGIERLVEEVISLMGK